MADDVKQPAGVRLPHPTPPEQNDPKTPANQQPHPGQQKAADLARVRDNQRRSRARRKEYLQELETKYRTCEQVGIGASAEIQAAARQVANENKRLRQILLKHGIPADELDGDLVSGSVVGELEAMIGKKRACGGGGGVGGSNEGFSSSSLASREQSLVAIQQDYSQIPDRGGGFRPLQPSGAGRQLSPQSGYESSSNSAAGGHATSPLNSTVPLQQQQQQQQQPLLPAYAMALDTGYTQQQQQQQTSSSSMYATYSDYAPQQQQQQHYDQQQQTPNHDFYQPQDPSSSSYTPPTQDQTTLHQRYQHHQPTSNSSSCRAIAAAIRYVRPNLSQHDLERELGCQPGGASEEEGMEECHVPNYEAFDLMDRLSEGGGRR